MEIIGIVYVALAVCTVAISIILPLWKLLLWLALVLLIYVAVTECIQVRVMRRLNGK